jgi:hypothetical protein
MRLPRGVPLLRGMVIVRGDRMMSGRGRGRGREGMMGGMRMIEETGWTGAGEYSNKRATDNGWPPRR